MTPPDDRIWFEVPLEGGKAQVRVPYEMRADEAARLGRVVAAVLAAMFPAPDTELVSVRAASGGVRPDGTTNTPEIDWTELPTETAVS